MGEGKEYFISILYYREVCCKAKSSLHGSQSFQLSRGG